MRQLVVRILWQGLLVAGVLLVVGYFLGDLAAAWVGTGPGNRPLLTATDGDGGTADPSADLRDRLRSRVPFALAGWGFGLVAVFETLGWIVRRGRRPTPTPPAAMPADVEALLNQLLQQAEAAKAAGDDKRAGGPPGPG